MTWRALTLEVAAAQAETLSDALLEQGAQSVWLGEPGEARLQMHALFDAGADAVSRLHAAAAAAGCALPRYRSYDVADEDWVRATRAQFRPQCIAGKLWIVPTWHVPPPGAQAVLRLDPGLAFGTGSHPSTRLVLAWLVARDLTGARVLDYGCGSGILAIAAARLGAARVDAVDLDADALGATAGNARVNSVSVGAYAPERLPPGDYDFVVANILAQPLIILEPLLAARTRAGGRAALSGILEAQACEVVAAYGAHFAARVAAREAGWALIEGVRR